MFSFRAMVHDWIELTEVQVNLPSTDQIIDIRHGYFKTAIVAMCLYLA